MRKDHKERNKPSSGSGRQQNLNNAGGYSDSGNRTNNQNFRNPTARPPIQGNRPQNGSHAQILYQNPSVYANANRSNTETHPIPSTNRRTGLELFGYFSANRTPRAVNSHSTGQGNAPAAQTPGANPDSTPRASERQNTPQVSRAVPPATATRPRFYSTCLSCGYKEFQIREGYLGGECNSPVRTCACPKCMYFAALKNGVDVTCPHGLSPRDGGGYVGTEVGVPPRTALGSSPGCSGNVDTGADSRKPGSSRQGEENVRESSKSATQKMYKQQPSSVRPEGQSARVFSNPAGNSQDSTESIHPLDTSKKGEASGESAAKEVTEGAKNGQENHSGDGDDSSDGSYEKIEHDEIPKYVARNNRNQGGR